MNQYQQSNNKKGHLKSMIIAIVILAVLIVGAVIVINKVKNSNTVAEKAAIEEYGYNIYSYDRNSDPVYYMHGYSCVKKTIENNGKEQIKYGYIKDDEKKVVVPCIYDDWSKIHGWHYVILKMCGKYGVVDMTNTVFVPFKYDEITVNVDNKSFDAKLADTIDSIAWPDDFNEGAELNIEWAK